MQRLLRWSAVYIHALGWLLCVTSGFDLMCPHPSQRNPRIARVCNGNATLYSCLKNKTDSEEVYTEACTTKDDYVRSGLKYIILGTFGAFGCSPGRYQPIRFWSNKDTDCLLLKNTCNELGQIVHDNNSREQDSTCRCDNSKGFAFVSQPNKKCLCKPSEEDCSCYRKTCPENSKLSVDYECISVHLADVKYSCQQIYNSEKSVSDFELAIVQKDYRQNESWSRSDKTVISYVSISDAITGIVLALIIFIILITVGAFGYRWKSKKAQRRHAGQTENGQYGSYENVICNYSPHRQQEKQCTYTKLDEQNNHSDTEEDEDDETKALITPYGRFPLRRKRTRLFTYPFSELKADDSESDENIGDIEQDSSLSPSKRYSFPDVSFTKVSIQNNILDSGITDFTSRKEPHKILQSFNVQDNRVIEKVQKWDCKFNWSDKNNHRRTFSAYNFLATHASGQESALRKVRGWENKEELSTKFMRKVARHLGPRYKFRSFSRELGLSDTDLMNRIQQNYKGDVVEQGYQVLLKLKQKELIQTETDLINKIQDLGFNEIVAKINNHANITVKRLCS